MSRLQLLAGLVCVIAPLAFAAAPPPVTPQTREILKLIEQLNDSDYRYRDLAEKRLALAGKAALPHLKAALAHKELEVRRRAMRLIPGIETAMIFSPKHITLAVKNQPLNKVLEELSKSSGYKVMNASNGIVFMPGVAVPQPAPGKADTSKEKQFTYDFKNEPFWDAVDRICRDTGLTVQHGYGDEIVRLYPGTPPPHVGRFGPFRYVGSNIQLYRNVDLSSSTTVNRSETLTFSFYVYVEPRLSFMGQGEPRLDSAYDDLKNSMLIKRAAPMQQEMWFGGGRWVSRRFHGGYKQQMMSVSVQLERRSEKATMMKSLKGAVPMTMLVEQRPIVISEKILTAKGVKKEIGDLTFEVKEAKKLPNNQVQVQFSVTNKQSNDYSWQNNLYNRIELFDDKGNKYQIWGTSWGGSGANNVQMTLTYYNGNNAKIGDPTKFVFMHWEMKQYDVEFEFKDIPLP